MHRHTSQRLAAVACAAVLALGLAGCGGDRKAAAPVTDEGFKARTNALCTTANAELKTMEGQLPSVTTQARGDDLAEKIADRIDELVADVLSLPAPNDIRPGVVKLLETVTGVSTQIHNTKLAFFKNIKTDPFADADTQSRALGLNACRRLIATEGES